MERVVIAVEQSAIAANKVLNELVVSGDYRPAYIEGKFIRYRRMVDDRAEEISVDQTGPVRYEVYRETKEVGVMEH